MWFELLRPGGRLAAADLDPEDGSFHGDNTGVFHLGFERPALKALLEKTGFQEVRITTAASMVKDIPGGGQQEFSLLLLLGRK
jgi:tRNA (cmo5U34)-methyltransferase